MSCSSMQDLVGGLGVGCYKTLDTVTVDFYFFNFFFPLHSFECLYLLHLVNRPATIQLAFPTFLLVCSVRSK